MTTYKITTDDGVVYVRADLAQAAAPIIIYFGNDPFYDQDSLEPFDETGVRWQSTQFQTADCQHYENRLASLVATDCDMGEVHSIEIVEGK